MVKKPISRRQMLAVASAGTLGTVTGWSSSPRSTVRTTVGGELAFKGGTPVRTAKWPDWPVWDESAVKPILEMYESGNWYRSWGNYCQEFEREYAQLIGARSCLATASGTTALMIALHALGVDAGDEVLVSPFTFIASYNAIFALKALPVFVDSDPETFLLDPDKIERRITERTVAILPVHIYGLPCDMDRINAIARKHNLKVVEDACQAWSARYRGKNIGLHGDLGCFSFQNSKNLPAGEGGAVVGDNAEIMDFCTSYHNCGKRFGSVTGDSSFPIRGVNFRMQHVQALILRSQMKRFARDAATRESNARYLDSKLKEIPGIVPYKLVEGAERSAYHLYPFRYLEREFGGAPKQVFLEALRAEGIPGNSGYGPQNKYGLIEEALRSKGFQRLFDENRLRQWREENVLPGNDRLCEEACNFRQNVLLGSREDMEDIVRAISKIYENRSRLV